MILMQEVISGIIKIVTNSLLMYLLQISQEAKEIRGVIVSNSKLK